MNIRCLTSKDIPSLRHMLQSGEPYITPYPEYIYWVMAEYFSDYCFIAEANEKIVGFIASLPYNQTLPKKIFILQIYTDDAFRNKHIASQLLSKLLEQNHDSDLILELSINPQNIASLKLFEKFAHSHNAVLISTNKSFDYTCYEKVYRIEIIKKN